jgi:hypothetical protein
VSAEHFTKAVGQQQEHIAGITLQAISRELLLREDA